MLLVILAHLWNPCPKWVALLTAGYMQVFFVMAGVTAVASSLPWRERIIQKSKRLLLPYAFYGIGLLCIGLILPTQADVKNGLLGLLYGRYTLYPPSIEPNFPLLQSCGYLSPLWFLPCIFLSYVLLEWYDHSRRPYLIVMLSITVGIATPLLPILMPWSIEMAFVGFLLMLCGRWMRPLVIKKSEKPDSTDLFQWLLGIGCAVLYGFVWWNDAPINMSLSQMGNSEVFFPIQCVLFIILGVCEALFLSVLFCSFPTSIITRSAAYIGRQAMRLMCIHLFIGQGMFYVLARWDVPFAVSFCCALIVILLINFLLDRLLKRTCLRDSWAQYL